MVEAALPCGTSYFADELLKTREPRFWPRTGFRYRAVEPCRSEPAGTEIVLTVCLPFRML